MSASLDDYFTSIERLADLVQQALDKPGSIRRGEIRAALDAYVEIRKLAGGGPLSQRSES